MTSKADATLNALGANLESFLDRTAGIPGLLEALGEAQVLIADMQEAIHSSDAGIQAELIRERNSSYTIRDVATLPESYLRTLCEERGVSKVSLILLVGGAGDIAGYALTGIRSAIAVASSGDKISEELARQIWPMLGMWRR